MRIIIEGSDLTGKTTLANKLMERFNLKYMHISGSDPNTYDFYLDTMLKQDNIVIDRHFIGEMIYPQVFNRKGNLTEEMFMDLGDIANVNNVMVIVLSSDDDTLMQRLSKRKEPKEVEKNILFINGQFKKLARKLSLKYGNVFNFDTTWFKDDFILDFIESFFKDRGVI